MQRFVSSLKEASTAEGVESSIEGATLEVLSKATGAERETARAALEAVPAALLANAKLRRRIRRLIDTLAKPAELALSAAATSAPPRVTATTGSSSSSSSSSKLSMPEGIRALQNAKSARDVEAVLNNLALPEKEDGQHNQEFLSHRDRLKGALDKLSTEPSLTTAVLRKRIKKLGFALLPDAEKEKVKSTVKPVVPQQVKRKPAPSSAAPSVPPPPPLLPGKSMMLVVSELRAAKSADEVDQALTGFTEGSVSSSSAGVAELSAMLNSKLDAGDELNAKVRRKIKRCLEMLSGRPGADAGQASFVSAPNAAGGNNNNNNNNNNKRVRESTSVPPVATLVVTAPAKRPATALKTIISGLQMAIQHADAAALETTLALVASIDPGDASRAGALVTMLEGLAARGAEGLTINSALKRRITRAVDALKTAAAAAGSSDQVATAAATIVVHNPLPGRDLTPNIAAASTAKDNAALVAALADVARGDGNVTTRRKLFRLISHMVIEGSVGGVGQMTDKTKARCLAVMAFLQPTANSGSKILSLEEAQKLGVLPKEGKGSKRARDSGEKPAPGVSTTPHVIFLGQLPFESTREDIEALLHTAELADGAPIVRLLTDESGASRGMAFVQLASAEDQHRCLSLHHSVVRGRKINVEKSCGGKDQDKRREKLASQREEQRQKVHAKISLVVDEFVQRGVLAGGLDQLSSVVRERLLTYAPAHVGEVLSNLEKAGWGKADAVFDSSLQAALDRAMDGLDRKLLRTSGGGQTKRRRVGEAAEEEEEQVLLERE